MSRLRSRYSPSERLGSLGSTKCLGAVGPGRLWLLDIQAARRQAGEGAGFGGDGGTGMM